MELLVTGRVVVVVVVELVVVGVVVVVVAVVTGALVGGTDVDVSVSCANATAPGVRSAPTTNMPIETVRVVAPAMVVLSDVAGPC